MLYGFLCGCSTWTSFLDGFTISYPYIRKNIEAILNKFNLYKRTHLIPFKNPDPPTLEDLLDMALIIYKDLPKELYNLDILDGSPPCSTFSMAGQREDAWGVEKKFREGQKSQTLDDLLFVFIDTVAKLQPKVAIMENVEGLMLGNAWKYVQDIYKKFHEIGYKVKHWLLKGETIGVPQTRHRVFFVATKLDFDLDKVDMYFNYEPILYKDIKQGVGADASEKAKTLLDNAVDTDTLLSQAYERVYGKRSWFTHVLCRDNYVMPTVIAGHDCMWRLTEKTHCSDEDYRNAQTFPQDYEFGKEEVAYICGMSVPPLMIKRLVTRLIQGGLFNYKIKPGE